MGLNEVVEKERLEIVSTLKEKMLVGDFGKVGHTKRGRIPERMHAGILLYIEHGILPGHFLCSVLEKDLDAACANADSENRA